MAAVLRRGLGSGKSALALQLAHHRRAAGRPGMLFTGRDRTGESRLTSRLGIHADARQFDERTELAALRRRSCRRVGT